MLRIDALEEQVERDRERIRRLEERNTILDRLKIEAYIQPQLLVQSYDAAASPNLRNGVLPPGVGANDIVANADGTTTNGTFFRVRRARVRTTYETEAMRLFLQIDAFPIGGVGPGIGTILRNAESTAIVRWSRTARTELTAGLFLTPFRKELLEISMTRPFIERTWFVQNCFPLERDYGAHVRTLADDDRLVVDVSVVNGHALGEKTFVALPDLSRSKDLIAYATYAFDGFTVGASGYAGRGEIVDPQALRFKQFGKWAMNYEASYTRKTKRGPGETRISAELMLGRNMDAGVLYPFAAPTIPTNIGDDVVSQPERAFYLRIEQDLGHHFTAGYRYDMYTPNANIANDARDTHAFLAVAKISRNLRWMNELDIAIDNVHPVNTPAPSRHILAFSSVLQAMF